MERRRRQATAILAALAATALLGVLRFASSDPRAAVVLDEWSRVHDAERSHRSLAIEDETEPRVAHCLVGQARTLAHPMIYENYEAHLLSKIGAPSDVFFVIDAPNEGTNAFDPVAVEIMPVRTQWWQYLRWIRCMALVVEHEKETGVEYSHVIFQRADQLVLQDLPSIETFPQTSMWGKYYGETMDEYPSTYAVGDEGAMEARELFISVSDLFLVLPRTVAASFIHEIAVLMRGSNPAARSAKDCGTWGMQRARGELLTKCAASRAAIPVVLQPFQLRILREHQKGGCDFFRRDPGKHYNSLCI